jgi:hypothetical protein
MNRRQFTGHLVTGAAVVAIGSEGFVLTGCAGGGSIWSKILSWVPVGEAALNSILSVLTANGILIAPGLQVIVGLIEAGFSALTAAIKEYQSTTPPPVGALQKIETAFKDIVDNFKTFLASLNVSGGLLSIIVGLAQVIFSTIAAFMNQVPASFSLKRTVVLGDTFGVGSRVTGTIVPKMRSRGQFKKDFNSQLDGGRTVGVTVPQNAYLKLSFFEHF